MLDILIQNATIVDGSGAPRSHADVAIQDDHIAEVGSLNGVVAKAIIDASDGALLPGFIDMHSHADLSLLTVPEADSLVHQGITTVVTGQCSLSPAPLTVKHKRDILAMLKMMMPSGVTIPWDEMTSFGGFLDYLERVRPAVNVAPLVGQGLIRAAVLGFRPDRPTRDQLHQMQRLVHEALDHGAFGLSTGLIYPPGSFSSTDELVEVVRPVGRRGALYASHIRGESETLIDSIAEAIHIGRQTGAAVQISHLKAAGKANWKQATHALQLIDAARDEGLDISADMYPYTAGSTYLAALLPRWATRGGMLALLRRLTLPWERARLIRAMQAGECGDMRDVEWDQILICASKKPAYVGHYVSELAAQEGKDPYTWTLDALLKTRGKIFMTIFLMSEDNLRLQLQHPAIMFGTDGAGLKADGPTEAGLLHPRAFGTYPRIFGHYVRDENLLSLEQASWKASGFPAQKLGLVDRGLIKKGYKADLVLLDPGTIADRATYTQPCQFPTGIKYVFVNGQLVVAHGKQTSARPGTVLRRIS